ncbi:hypothetical protein HID58_061422, partial [Brassica napus]
SYCYGHEIQRKVSRLHREVTICEIFGTEATVNEIKATDVDVIPKIPHLLEAVSEREFTLTCLCRMKRSVETAKICDMLFTATSHRLADFIFSLGNYCLQLSDRERIYVKLKITSDLMFVNQMK